MISYRAVHILRCILLHAVSLLNILYFLIKAFFLFQFAGEGLLMAYAPPGAMVLSK